ADHGGDETDRVARRRVVQPVAVGDGVVERIAAHLVIRRGDGNPLLGGGDAPRADEQGGGIVERGGRGGGCAVLDRKAATGRVAGEVGQGIGVGLVDDLGSRPAEDDGGGVGDDVGVGELELAVEEVGAAGEGRAGEVAEAAGQAQRAGLDLDGARVAKGDVDGGGAGAGRL